MARLFTILQKNLGSCALFRNGVGISSIQIQTGSPEPRREMTPSSWEPNIGEGAPSLMCAGGSLPDPWTHTECCEALN